MQADDNTLTDIETEDSTSFEGDQPGNSISVGQDKPENSIFLESDVSGDSTSFGRDELDDSTSLEGNEPGESMPSGGSEFDDNVQEDAAGIELDELTPIEGDKLDEATPFSGSELDDDAQEQMDGREDPISANSKEDDEADNREAPVAATETAIPGLRKKALLLAAAGLCMIVLGVAMYGTVFRPEKKATPKTVAIAIPRNPSLNFDDFVIPFLRESNHYISLSISLRSANGAVLNELNLKKEIFRGRIYDLIKAHVDQAAGHPSLAATKQMIADSINAWLTAGRVDGVYITRFIIR